MDDQPDHTQAAIQDLQVDPVGGRWEEHEFEEELFFHHNITSGTYKKTYYLPVEYPQLMIQPEKFYELDSALFYVPEAIEWSIEDVRCQMDVKLTAGENTPLAMNDMGMLVFNPAGDMLVGDRLFPYSQYTHHDEMQKIINRSINKESSFLLDCELYMNQWPDLVKAAQKGINYRQMVPVRDPRFFEKNNVAETVQFAAAWKNDVGLRIPMHCLLAPPLRTQTKHKRFKWVPLTSQWELEAGTFENESIVTYPVDYRNGMVTTPPSTDEMLFQCARKKKDKNTFFTGSRKKVRLVDSLSVMQDCPFPSYQDGVEECFTAFDTPLSTEQWNSQLWRDMPTTQSLISTERTALWTKQTRQPLRPRWQPFTGNKTMKPLYIRFDIARKGADILPYWTYFKFRYKFRLKAFYYTPQLERPIFHPNSCDRVRFNPQETKFAGDMLVQNASHLNPYRNDTSATGNIDSLVNSWNKTFIPNYQKMYVSFKKETT